MNPKIEIAIDAKNRTISSITGMLTVGAKVDVEITGLPSVIPPWGGSDDYNGPSVRFRIVDELGDDLVRFPHVKKTTATDGDQWQVTGTSPNQKYKTYNGTSDAQVDFDTDKLRKAFFGVAFNDRLEFGVIIDSIVDAAEYAIGKVKIQQWAHASTDTPTVLPDWREIKAGLDNATARVEKPAGSDTATIYITDTHGNTTTAEVKDGATGAQGAPGATGPTGAAIESTIFTRQDEQGGNVYTQTFDNGTTAEFTAPKGATGDAGPANTLSIGTVTGGTTASATITGTSPNQTLSLVLPKGDKGDDGEAGPQGDGSYIYDPSDQKWHNVTVYTDPVTGEKTTNVSTNGTSVRPSVDSPTATVTQTATGATITTTDATHGTRTATVTNGTNGTDGVDGQDGEDGTTPHVGENGNWFIGTNDTGVLARGTNGTDGTNGTTPHIDTTTKHWMIGHTDTQVVAEGVNGVTPVITGNKPSGSKTTTIYSNGVQIATIQDGVDGTGSVSGAKMNNSSVDLDQDGVLQFGTVLTDASAFAAASHDHSASDITSGTLSSDRLPMASSTAKGAVMPVAKTPGMTMNVGVDSDGKLYAAPTDISGKQDVISDLAMIRSGAAAGATAVQKNAEITAGTKCKITYDAKGLVTNGSDLSASDIPSLDASKITGGTFSDERIASASTWNAKQPAITSSSKLSSDLVDDTNSTNKFVTEAQASAIAANSAKVSCTDETVGGFGYTKNAGTYSKPSGGIPSSDLSSDVQAALTNARTPTAHASTHATNGPDAITPDIIGAMASNVTHLSGDVANLDTATCAGVKVVASDPGTYTPNVIYFIKASS